jgi:hypothetical protein
MDAGARPEFAQVHTLFVAARTAGISDAEQELTMQGVASVVIDDFLDALHWQL